jgi:hypothetical protein
VHSGSTNTINHVPSSIDTISTDWTGPPPIQYPKRLSPQHGITDLRQQNLHLVPPELRSFSSQWSVEDTNNSIVRFYQDEEPWNPHQLRNSNVTDIQKNFNQPEESFRHYLQGPFSVDNTATVSDSGYYTQPTNSVLSNEPNRINEELSPEVMIQARSINIESAPSESQEMQRMPSGQRSVSKCSTRSGSKRQQIICSMTGCFQAFEHPTEHRYAKSNCD